MIQARPIISRPHSSVNEAVNYLTVADSPIDRILQKISKMELPEREHFESYMRHKWRMNHKPSTLLNSFQTAKQGLVSCYLPGLSGSGLTHIAQNELPLIRYIPKIQYFSYQLEILLISCDQYGSDVSCGYGYENIGKEAFDSHGVNFFIFS